MPRILRAPLLAERAAKYGPVRYFYTGFCRRFFKPKSGRLLGKRIHQPVSATRNTARADIGALDMWCGHCFPVSAVARGGAILLLESSLPLRGIGTDSG
ncbi:MAG: hypothetical protein ABIT23_07755, partial [Nitrosospira sp.]